MIRRRPERVECPVLYYPKIPGPAGARLGRCVAFEKLDGTNVHFDFERDFGWHAFGTRRDSFDLTPDGETLFAARHAHLAGVPAVFRATLADGLAAVLRDSPGYAEFASFRAFAEFLGPNSFAGLHRDADPKRLALFDVLAEPSGLVGPHRFVADFGHLPSAKAVHEGKFTGQFVLDVRAGKYGAGEGVVVKGGSGGADLWMAKVKTDAYLARLRAAFAERWRGIGSSDTAGPVPRAGRVGGRGGTQGGARRGRGPRPQGVALG